MTLYNIVWHCNSLPGSTGLGGGQSAYEKLQGMRPNDIITKSERGGVDTPTLTANFAGDVHSHYVNGRVNIAILTEIIDDIDDSLATAQQARDHCVAWAAVARANGWRALVCNSIASTEPPQATRDVCDALLIADVAGPKSGWLFDGLVNMSQYYAFFSASGLQGDGIHLSVAGAQRFAETVNEAINRSDPIKVTGSSFFFNGGF